MVRNKKKILELVRKELRSDRPMTDEEINTLADKIVKLARGTPNMRIRKVKALRGVARIVALKRGLKPDDLVIVDYSSGYIEKIEGDPVSYLLNRA